MGTLGSSLTWTVHCFATMPLCRISARIHLNELLRSRDAVHRRRVQEASLPWPTNAEGDDLTLPVVEFNGAFVSDSAHRQHRTKCNSIDSVVAEDILIPCHTLRVRSIRLHLYQKRGPRLLLRHELTTVCAEYLEDRLANQDRSAGERPSSLGRIPW